MKRASMASCRFSLAFEKRGPVQDKLTLFDGITIRKCAAAAAVLETASVHLEAT